jgi:acyl-CoA thioesterase-2
MSRAVDDLLTLLDLEPLEHNLFRGPLPQVGWQRVFGGQVIGQALGRGLPTVEGRGPHFLHAYFLSAGDPKVPIVYEVERLRDGRSFSDAAGQGDPARAGRSSRCRPRSKVEETGFDHQARMPDVPGREPAREAR